MVERGAANGAKVTETPATQPPGAADAVRHWTARLLWLSCHRRPDSRHVLEALRSGADPRAAATAALGHRIGGLLWRTLEAAGALDALADGREVLARAVEVQRLRELLLVPRALELAVGPLTRAGFEPLVLKGPCEAVRYPGNGLRPFDDLDLLLPSGQHAEALRVLRDAGWELARPEARDRYDSVLVHHAAPEMPLELHYALEAWYDRASSLRSDELWARRRPVDLFGVRAYALPAPEELVALCAHAAKPYHGFARLMWVADLAMLLGKMAEQGEDLDWGRVRALAAEGRCATALAAGLSLARLAGAESPAGLRALPSTGWRAEALRRLVAGEWVLRSAPPIHLRFALADDRRRRAMLLIGYAHPFPGVRGRLWYLRNVRHALRRWRDLRHGPGGPGGPGAGSQARPGRENLAVGPFSVRPGR